ncbi:MAG: 6-phosphofructokinase [Armatimonadota bacterium]
MSLAGNAVIGQSGGPTMVINASLVGAVQEAKKHDGVTGFYGAMNGIEGVLHERMIDLGAATDEQLEAMRTTPSAAIGTVRLKVDERDLERALDVFEAHNIRYFFYAGGNDSQQTSLSLSEAAAARGYDLVCVGIPKTIDNDLPNTDHCPGYGSAARYLACALTYAGKDNEAFRDIQITECMGRDSGWLTAATALARGDEHDAPHLIYLPEVPFDDQKFIEQVLEKYHAYGRCVIATSEGIRYAGEDGEPDKNQLVAQRSEYTDAFGHPQLGGVAEYLGNILEDNLSYKVRSDKPGTQHRAFMLCASEVDLAEAHEVGRKAVELAAAGQTGQMVTLVRTSEAPYEWTTGITEFEYVAGGKRDIPLDWIADRGADVKDDFVRYVSPLVGESAPQIPNLADALPRYPRIELPRIDTKLGDYVDSRGWWLDKARGRWIRCDINTEWRA